MSAKVKIFRNLLNRIYSLFIDIIFWQTVIDLVYFDQWFVGRDQSPVVIEIDYEEVEQSQNSVSNELSQLDEHLNFVALPNKWLDYTWQFGKAIKRDWRILWNNTNNTVNALRFASGKCWKWENWNKSQI